MTKQRLFTLFTITILALFALFPSVTFAQEDAPDDLTNRLEAQYAKLQEISVKGDEKLTRAHEIALRVEEGIGKLQERGIDTAVLEAALADFETAVANAEAIKAEGDAILDAHAGFDDAGNVTDRDTAAETIRAVQDSFKEARQTLHEGGRTLKHAIKSFRRDNRGNSVDGEA